MTKPRFNLLSLLRFAGVGMRRRGWLVVAAVIAWALIDGPLYNLIRPDLTTVLFVARRAVASLAMAVVVAAIVDGGSPGQGSFKSMAWGLVRAIPTVALAELLLWGPIMALQLVFNLQVVSPGPLVVGVIILVVLAAALLMPLAVPAAVDGGRAPWAALRTNFALLHRRRWLFLGLAALLLVAMVILGGGIEAGLDLLDIDWQPGPMMAFYLVFTLAAVMQAAAYLELTRINGVGAPERVADTFA